MKAADEIRQQYPPGVITQAGIMADVSNIMQRGDSAPKFNRKQRRVKENLERELDVKCTGLVDRYKLFYNQQVRNVQEAKIHWEGRTEHQKKALKDKIEALEREWQQFVHVIGGKAHKAGLQMNMRDYGNWFLRRIHAEQKALKK